MSLALHNAAREGNVAELTKLLAQSASVSVRDKHSRTPIHLAAWAGHLECCKVLVAEGADKSAAAMDDTTALHFAAQKGHSEIARFLLNEGVSINGKTRKGMTALMFAAQSGNVELVKLLIKRKADPASKNKNGKSAVDLTNDEAVKELLREAALAAAQQNENTARPDANNAQAASVPAASPAVDEHSKPETSAAIEIGPQERPSTSMPQAGDVPPTDDSKHTSKHAARKRISTHEHGILHEQPSGQKEVERPLKAPKIALSFTEEEDDEQ